MSLSLSQIWGDDFQVHVNDILTGKSCQYLVVNLIGEGSFGKVARCKKLDTKENVAIKIVRVKFAWTGKREASAFKKISSLDPNKNNLVRFFECFTHQGHVCLVLEMLDKDLHALVKERSLCLSEIRAISQQMLVALDALQHIGVVHTDIKPDNVMLVNHHSQPFRVKLIDFGCAIPISKVARGATIQAPSYRAPEVILGLPLDTAIDVWSLGCVMAFMYLKQHMFPVRCEYDILRVMVQIHGQPEEHLLHNGMYSKKFFTKTMGLKRVWRLKSRREYMLATGQEIQQCKTVADKYTCLDDMTKERPYPRTVAEHEDTRAFLSLVKRMLRLNPSERISPDDALGHRFITMTHLSREGDWDPYVESCQANMRVCPPRVCAGKNSCYLTSSEESLNVSTFASTSAAAMHDTEAYPERPERVRHGGSTHFVTVRTSRTTFRRLQGFFSGAIRAMCCCCIDID